LVALGENGRINFRRGVFCVRLAFYPEATNSPDT
jgi:hypothetical protein